MEKHIIIIAGPSGAGKTTVADLMIERLGNLEMSRSATTRAKRGDGRDDEYVYLTKEEFLHSDEVGDMLESTEYGGNYYGTRRVEIDAIFDKGKIPILVLDYNGVCSLKSKLSYPVFAFYVFTSLKEAESRLLEREKKASSDTVLSVAKKRCVQNREDYLSLGKIATVFDAYIENGDIEKCYSDIVEALDILRQGNDYMSDEDKKKVTSAFYSEAINNS